MVEHALGPAGTMAPRRWPGGCARNHERMPVPRTPPKLSPKLFETRSHAWRDVGLLRQISPRVVKRARLEALLLVPLFVGVVVIYDNRVDLFGKHVPARPGHPAHRHLEQALDAPITAVTVL